MDMTRGKRNLIILVAVFILLIAAATTVAVGYLHPRKKVELLNRVYTSSVQGATKESEITGALGPPSKTVREATPFWDSQSLTSNQLARITRTIDYSVKTFFIDIVFRYSFVETGVLVGKHRYD
jgi:hypothetical protein